MGHFAVLSRPLTRAFVAFTLVTASQNRAFAQVANVYPNTTIGTITDNNCGTAGQIVRTINVPTSFIVGDVNLGVFASHTYRSDLRITLRSPSGTTVTVMTWSGNVQSGDNLNDLFDDEAAAAISTHNATVADPLTPAPPAYSHSFRPSNPLSAFDGQNAGGNWVLTVCDGVSADTGQFRRADLYITPAVVSVAKTSSIITDGISGSAKAIPGAIVQYCVLITNANGIPTTNVIPSDPIPNTATYVPGSLMTGSTCASAALSEDDDSIGADENDPYGVSVSGNIVTGNIPTLAANASFAMIYRATIN